jgi:flagellar biogenesis protein FliO
VNSLRLGPKHRLDVVEYEGKRLLLGVAANQITLLDNQQLESASETAPADDAADPAAETQSAQGSFAGQLRRLMQPNKTP